MKSDHDEEANSVESGRLAYQRWSERLEANPEFARVYEEEAAKSELWLRLVEARLEAGLTQEEMAKRLGVSAAQVADIEERGYDTCTLTTLREYVQALDGKFELVVKIEPVAEHSRHPLRAAS
jgi:DNA-binding XRE family transcriptional regulator